MNTNRIEFISEYCDRWCERCAFTERCSTFAVETAIAMCGDVADGIELAVGKPHPEEGATLPGAAWLEEFADFEMTATETTEFIREREECDARIHDTVIMRIAEAFTILAHRWLAVRAETMRVDADVALSEALEIAAHDAAFITVKLTRALTSRDGYSDLNDADGSTKAALICIERSQFAWRLIADASGDETAEALSESLIDLRREVEEAFPKAWSFVRPGFDEFLS